MAAPKPVWLADITVDTQFFDPAFFDPAFFQTTTVVKRASIRDLDSLATAYEGLVAEWPTVTRSYSDPVRRVIATDRVSLGLSDTRANLQEIYDADPRTLPLSISRYDEADAFQASRFIGKISGVSWDRGLLRLEASTVDFAVLDDPIPKLTIGTETFPDAVDLGGVVYVVFGPATNVFLPCVKDDKVNSLFYYLAPLSAGGGAISVNAIRRTGVGDQPFENVDASEYTVSTVLFPGYTTLVFARRQEAVGGELVALYGDFSSASAVERNPVRCIRNILSSTTWGLSQTVNAASFDAGEAAIDAIGSLFADGVLRESRPAIEVLSQLCLFRGIALGTNAAGEWTVTVDTQRTPAAGLTLRDGVGDGERNAERVGPRARRSTDDRIRRVVVGYRPDLITNEFVHHMTRDVAYAGRNEGGRDEPFDLPFVRVGLTAWKIMIYLAARIAWADETLAATGVQALRSVGVGDVVPTVYDGLGVDGLYEVIKVTDALTSIGVDMQGGSATQYAGIYADVAPPGGAIPADPPGSDNVDLSRTAPSPATGITITAENVRRNAAGQDVGWSRLAWATPSATSNVSVVVPLHRIHATSGPVNPWTVDGSVPVDTIQAVEISPLVTTAAYDYGLRTVSRFGLSTDPSIEGVDLITNHPALVDVVAPDAPVGLAALAGTGNSITVTKTASTAADYDVTRWHRNTVNNFTDLAATAYRTLKGTVLVDTNVVQGTPYFYAARDADVSGNISGISGVVTATPSGGAQGTVPGTPSAPTHSSGGVYQDAQGMWLAYEVVNVPAMPAGAASMWLLARPTGATQWTNYAKLTTGGGTARLEGGAQGVSYDIALQAFNAFEQSSGISSVLTIVAAANTTAPGIPTFTLDTTKLTILTLRVTSAPVAGHKTYEWQVRTASSSADGSGGGSLVSSGHFEGVLSYNLADIGYAATDHVRIRELDMTGNPTVADGTGAKWSATQSFSFTAAGTVDLQANAVTDPSSASGTSTINTTSGTTADITDMSISVTTASGDLVIVTLRMREIKIENTSGATQVVTAFLEITDSSNAVINGDADDHWAFPLGAAGSGNEFVVVPVNIIAFDQPSAGSHTYKGRWRVSGSGGGSCKVTNANSRRLQAIRQKR